MTMNSKRTTAEKIALFRRFFTGLTHVYGTYDPNTGQARMVKEPVTDQVILNHLKGLQPYGVYLLNGNRTRAIVADFDTDDVSLPRLFVGRAKHYGLNAYIERSKSKGYHAWMFLDEKGVNAAKARLVVRHILEEIEAPDTEIFPKQDRLASGTSFGNFINAPLFGSLVLKGRTVFLSEDTFQPYPNQWDFLESVERVSEQALDTIIELNDLTKPKGSGQTSLSQATGHPAALLGLPPCAQRILAEGVTENQRVACFRLAVHMRRMGLPLDITISALKTWAARNRPTNGNRIITDEEIRTQANFAYEKSYRSYGCEDSAIEPYCDPTCAINRKKSPHGGLHQ